jgi:DNA-binding MarR family transcriptional regulator
MLAETAPSLQSGLGFRLNRATRAVRAAWAVQLADLDVSPPHAAVLRAASDGSGAGVRALARTLGTDPMNVKHLADDLERRGLIASGVEGDRRIRALRLTEAGQRLADEDVARVRQQEEWFTRVLGGAQRRQLERALDRLEEAFELTGPSKDSKGDSDAR